MTTLATESDSTFYSYINTKYINPKDVCLLSHDDEKKQEAVEVQRRLLRRKEDFEAKLQ